MLHIEGYSVFCSETIWCCVLETMWRWCCSWHAVLLWLLPLQGCLLGMDRTDWTVICTTSWSWHPHQPCPVAKNTKPQSMFYIDASFTNLQEEMCGLLAVSWWSNSMAASQSWRRWLHLSPELPWSCSLQTPRRRRKCCCSCLLAVTCFLVLWKVSQSCKGKILAPRPVTRKLAVG